MISETGEENPKRNCLVIMPFDKQFDELYEYGIVPAVETKKYRCFRLDQTLLPVNLIHEMIGKIHHADFIIADLTNQSANVFYELGVAHSIAKRNKTIMIAAEDEQLPFEIAQFQVLKYELSIKECRHYAKEFPCQN